MRSGRVCLVLGGLMFASFSAAQSSVTLDVSRAGKHVGTARFSFRITSTGAFEQHEDLSLATGGTTVSIIETGRDDRTGLPLTRLLHLSGGGQKATVSVIFADRIAKVGAKGPKGTQTRNVAAPKGANLHNTSEFWFIRDHPVVGAHVTYYDFDINRMQWKQNSDTYVGDETISIGGRKVSAHRVNTTGGPQWLDSRGLPYKLELKDSNITMVRTR